MMASITFLPKLAKTDDPAKRWPYAFGGILIAFIIGAGAIFVYNLFAHKSLVWFGLTAIVVFCALIFVKAVPQVRKLKRRD
ncbi:MAG: hypothetical protein FWF45_06775 [Coriobacteriia bacterium]|nr:hypothetical protein [Coriobacteriia bacterium]